MSTLMIHHCVASDPRVAELSDRKFRQLFQTLCAIGQTGIVDESVQWLFDEKLVKIRFGTARIKWNRLKLWRQFDGICHLCGEYVPFERFHVEHVIPIARGGRDEWGNLNIAHPSCNLAKGARILEELA